MKPLHIAVIGLAVFGISAAPAPDVEELLRRGNDAFAHGDYAAALDLFQKTEDLTGDPGLVAFNKAATLYRLALQAENARSKLHMMQEAEQSYRRSLEDATGLRRVQALYGQGNSLLQQHPSRGVKVLFDAIACFEQVIASSEADDELKDDARHNLELAKLLWGQERGQNDKDRPPENDGGSDDPHKDPPGARPDQSGNSAMGTPDKNGTKVPVQLNSGQQPIPVDSSPAPGAGNQPPPIPENDEPPLAVDDALAHLHKAVTEILREKQQYQMKSLKPPARGVKDW